MLPYRMGTIYGLDLRAWDLAVGMTPALLFATGLVLRFVRGSATQRAQRICRLLVQRTAVEHCRVNNADLKHQPRLGPLGASNSWSTVANHDTLTPCPQ
jgi:hypothetical protein